MLSKSPGKRRFYLFDRCSGGILNLRFDSDLLESFYSECSFPRAKGRFRFGITFIAMECVVWMLFFGITRPPQWIFFLLGLACELLISVASLGSSFVREFFKKHYLWISGLYSCLCVLLALLPFAVDQPPASLAFNLSSSIQLIILIYTMIPLRLWQLYLICGPLSLIQLTLASIRYGYIGASNILVHVVAHVIVHIIGFILYLMSQVWRRSTFLRLGYSALMRKELKKEKELRDDMIRSLMPNEVAQEVMRDVGHDSGAQEVDTDAVGSTRKPKKNKKHRRKSFQTTSSNAMQNTSDSGDVVGFSDVFYDDEDEMEDMKPCVVNNADVTEQGVEANAVDAVTSSPRGSMIPKTGVVPPQAVAFRKFHVSQLENVSVLFADIVGFTKMSSNKSASHLVYLLNDLFGRFDRLCELTGCEKIATLGDCYYCVAGCPNSVADHAERAVEMGRAMCLAIQQFDEDHKEEVNMRVGVHTGKVICGLVGTRRFKFDVWSNDVTLANEMESTGQAGRVHISEATYSFVKDIYEVTEGEAVHDIRKFKVLVEFFNKEEQCFAIKHTQDESMIKTYFVERRFDGKPVCSAPHGLPLESGVISVDTSPETEIACVPTHPLISSYGISNKAEENKEARLSNAASTVLQEHRVSLDQKPTNVQPPGRGSDAQMLDALKGLAKVEDVFSFPPISRFTLNFFVHKVESHYRRLGLGRPKGKAINRLSWSTPRIAPLINGAVQLIIFTTVLITCVIVFPGSQLAPYPSIFYAVASVAALLHLLFMLLLFVDLAAWSCRRSDVSHTSDHRACNWRRCVLRTYAFFFKWPLRNVMGAVLLILPTTVVLSNFSPSFFSDFDAYPDWFVAHYRLLNGLLFTFMLFNFTLFVSFSFWTKSLSTLVGCAVTVTLIYIQVQHSPGVGARYGPAWKSVPSLTPTPWMKSVLHSSFVAELTVILFLTLLLISALNREFDISFRLSFHRDYEALEAKRAIAHQKVQADWLLENIIPYYIMDDLRQTSKYSKHIDDAAVVFATISNFAEFYDEQYQGGQEMLRVLNEIFADFEHLLAATKYKDVEKIKTIGACFMAASGLNLSQRQRNELPDSHLLALMDFALDLVHILDDFNRQMFNFQFEMKVGYNIGEVTAGVIGTTKLLYDIWGDTVNVASRMYSTGQKGRIQVTEAVAKRLESHYVFDYRGEVFVKGKGNMKTYLLSHRRSVQTSS